MARWTSSRRRFSRLGISSIALVAAVAAGVAAANASTPPTEAQAERPAPRELAFRRAGWIYLIREDGRGLRRLVRGSAPSWSPDGSKIVFARFDWLYVVGADGRGERRLARAGRGFSPAWSPDGKRIAFTSRRSGAHEIYVVNVSGTGLKRLTSRQRRDEDTHSPAWSPDGKWIAFSSNRPTLFNPEIYVMRADGSGVRRLTHTRGADAELGDDGMPSWSPDGKRIVFTSNRTQDGAIWVMGADGANERLLFGLPRTDEWYPRFSPDGREISFTRLGAGGSEQVWIMRSDGTAARKLTDGGDAAWRPAARSSRAPSAQLLASA